MRKLISKAMVIGFLMACNILLLYRIYTNPDVTGAPARRSNSYSPWLPPYKGFMLVIIILFLSYLVRVTFMNFSLLVPNNVILFGLGLIAGNIPQLLPFLYDFLFFEGNHYVFFYVAILLFELTFCLDVPIFLKILPQILVIGIPLALLQAVLYGIMAKVAMNNDWPIEFGILFGLVSAAIYPKCITRSLKQQSTRTKQISVLLEGEAILTIIVTEVARQMYRGSLYRSVIQWYQFISVLLRFIIFGVITGYLAGLFARCLIKKVYTNKLSVFLLCFSLPFFTHTFSQIYGCGCGAIPVAILGIILGFERTILSKEIESFLIEFWEMLAFILDMILSFKHGVITIQATICLHLTDYTLVLGTYLLYMVIRFFCFLIFSPITSRLGYGMDFKNMLICVWCGLKCPLSTEIVLFVINKLNKNFCEELQLCFYIIGTYFFTNLFNATFIGTVLESLGLNVISTARQMNMNNCMKHLFIKRERLINILKTDRFLADTNWALVIHATNIRHPYHTEFDLDEDDSFFLGYRFTFCSDCKKDIPVQPTPKEMEEMTKEAKTRVLKAKKMSYSRQFENGMISQEGVQILFQAVELALDSENAEIDVEELYARFTKENCFQRFIRKRAQNLKNTKKTSIRPPRTFWRRVCYHLVVTNKTFAKIMLLIILINLVTIFLEMYFHPSIVLGTSATPHESYVEYILFALKILFTLIYLIEFVIKILAYSTDNICYDGIRHYFKSFWNITDFMVIIIYFLGIHISLVDIQKDDSVRDEDYYLDIYRQVVDCLTLFRVLRLLQVWEVFYPDIVSYLDNSTDWRMAFTYELGKSYATGETEILDMLPHMIDNKKIRENIRKKIEGDKVSLTKLLGLVQKEKPWIAITVKTKQAIKTILNGMCDAIKILKSSGWIDSYEYDTLMASMNELYKKVNSIKKVQPSPPKVIFKEVAWMAEDDAVIDFLFENVTVKKFEPGEIVFGEGTVADGIYIVVTGLFMITYTPNPYILQSMHEYGLLPVVDYLPGSKYDEPSVDYVVSGNCLGEFSSLTGRSYNCTVTADAHSQVYVLTRGVLKRAMELSSDHILGLECRIWKEISVRIAIPLLLATPAYHTFSQDQIKFALERAFVPNLSKYKIFTVTDVIEDIILIQGVVADFNTREMFAAPCYIPRTVQKLILPASSLIVIPIDTEIKLLIIPTKDVDEYDVMMVAEETGELVHTASSLRCLQHTIQDRIKTRKRRRLMRGIPTAFSGASDRTLDSLATSMSRFSDERSLMYFKSERSEVASSVFIPIENRIDEAKSSTSGPSAPMENTESPSMIPKRRRSLYFN